MDNTIILPAGTVFYIPPNLIQHPHDDILEEERPYWQGILDMFGFHGITHDYNNHSMISVYEIRAVTHVGDNPQTVYWRDDTPIFSITNNDGHYAFYPFVCQCHHHHHCGCDNDCTIGQIGAVIVDDSDDEECHCECHGEFDCTCFSHCHTPM